MTISEIADRVQTTAPYFFAPQTMRFFRQSMSDFTVEKQADGRFRVSAPLLPWPGEGHSTETIRYFNPITNELEAE